MLNPDLIFKGGPLVLLLLCCLILSFAIFLERLAYFHRASMNVGEFLSGLASLIRRKNYSEALQECVATRVPVGRVLHAAILRHRSTREQLKEIVQEAGQLEVPRLERYLSVLNGIAHVAPLIGLLGTIGGLIDIFVKLKESNSVMDVSNMAPGVYQSLIDSAIGLVVAIPSFLFYAFLSAKSRHLMHDLERAGIEITNILEDNREPEPQTIPMPAVTAQIVDIRDAELLSRRARK